MEPALRSSSGSTEGVLMADATTTTLHIHQAQAWKLEQKRRVKTRVQPLLVLLYALAVAGFPAVTLIPSIFALPSRTATVPYRIAFLCISLVVLILHGLLGRRFARGPYWILAFLLWVALLLRMYFDLIVHPVYTSIAANDYWLYTLGLTLLPQFAFGIKCNHETYIKARRASFLLALIATPIILTVALRGSFQEVLGGRLGTDVLNPISLGHLGAALVILSIVAPPFTSRSLAIIARVVGCGTGLLVVLLSDARGPQVALVVCIFLFVVKKGRRGLATIILLAATLVYPYLQAVDYAEGSTSIRIFGRWSEFQDVADSKSAGVRVILMIHAVEQFMEHPLTGNSLVEEQSGDYPHNIILESFMSIGVFGGAVLLCMIVVCCRATLVLLSAGDAYSWIGLLYAQQLVGSMFSGSLLVGETYWVWSAAVFAAYTALQRDKVQHKLFCKLHPSFAALATRGSAVR
jgi:hypothetical protein